jgi:hypothetical protein
MGRGRRGGAVSRGGHRPCATTLAMNFLTSGRFET